MSSWMYIFFFKQKTAYEMRISDWSSDVCSSDLATRLLRPVQAVLFAAFFNFAAYFLSLAFPALHKVAETIGAGLIDKDLVTPAVVFGALVGAMFWNRSDERRVGKGCVSTCRYRWSPEH